jgi:LysM repeat protein
MADEPSCSYCDRPAESHCRRCGRDYCALHGDDLCLSCSESRSVTPSGRLFRAVLAGFGACIVVGVWMLVASPRLPGEAAVGPKSQSLTSAPTPARSALPVPSSAPSVSPTAAATRAYTVQSGDTVASIAQAIGVSPGSIVQLNPGIDANNLQIGQTMLLPVLQSP